MSHPLTTSPPDSPILPDVAGAGTPATWGWRFPAWRDVFWTGMTLAGVGTIVALAGARRARRTTAADRTGPARGSVGPRWHSQRLRYRLGATVTPTAFSDTLSAVRPRPAPRVVPFVVVKRRNTRLGRTYGHWWIELDGAESYGWWPRRCPVTLWDFVLGTAGTLNGRGGSCYGGGLTLDPHHLDPADHQFHPTLVTRKSDRRLRADIRAFAHAYRGGWRWSIKPTPNCRSFQLSLLEAVGLEEGSENLHTRGRGCPLLYPFRLLRDARCSGGAVATPIL
ncbi:MAG TPA: hypothetical protein VM142_01495 [Acidimicrobiales bacterium]|nr:hypothetical protein [Acidimicrobiales bacterium]